MPSYGCGPLHAEVDFDAAGRFAGSRPPRSRLAAASASPSSRSKAAGAGGTIKIGIDLPVERRRRLDGIPTQQRRRPRRSRRPTRKGAARRLHARGRRARRRGSGHARPGAGRAERQDVRRRSAVLGDGRARSTRTSRKARDPAHQRRGPRADQPSTTNPRPDQGRRREEAARVASRRQRLLPRLHDRRPAGRGRRAVRQEARLQEGLHHRRQRDVRQGPGRRLRGAIQGRRRHGARPRAPHQGPARLQGAAHQGQGLEPDVVFYGGTTVDGRRPAAQADGRRRPGRGRRSSAATASATTSSSRPPGAMADGTLLHGRRARTRRSCRSAQRSSRPTRRSSTADVGAVQRQRLRRGADR